MKRLVPLLLAPALSLGVAAKEPLPPPQWSAGMTWTVAVRSSTRRLLAEPKDGVWYTSVLGKPRLWNFEIYNEETIEGFPARRFKLRALRSDGGAPPVELDYVARVSSKNRIRTLAVEGFRFGGGAHRVVRDLRKEAAGPSPVLLRAAPLPVGFPLMDVSEPGARRFKKTRMVGQLPFADDVLQLVVGGDEAREKARRLGVDPGDRKAWVVELRRPLDEERVSQVWIDGDPWPAWADAGLVQSTLLDVN